MYSHPPKLLISGVPNADESFGGYILRLTQWNFYRTSSWILKRAGISRDHLHNGYSILFNQEPNFLRLAQLTGVDIAKLQVLAYPHAVPSETPHRHMVFGRSIQKNFIRLRFTKICPECLQNANYCRKVWDLAPVTTCPSHKILLLDRCPCCNRRITWVRSKVNYCKCGLDWHSVSPIKTADAELKLTEQIHTLLGLKKSGDKLSQFSNSNPLYNLDLEDLLTLIYFIAGQLKGSVLKNGWQLLSLSNADLHSLLTRAFSIFADWPKQYFEFLDWRKGQKNWSKATTGLVKDFGAFYIAIYQRLLSNEFNFMREQFEEYITRYWKGGSLAPRTRLKNTSEFRKKHLTKTEASIQLKCYTTRIDRLIEAGRLKAVVQRQKSRRLFLVDADSLNRFKMDLQVSSSLQEVSSTLGICDKVVLALVQHKALDLLCGPPIDASHAWRFPQKAAAVLMNKLTSKVSRVGTRGAHKINFKVAAKKIGYIGLKSDELIRSVIDGTIRPYGAGPNIPSLLFIDEHIDDFVQEQIRIRRGNDNVFTVAEAAPLLGFKTLDTIYFLAKKGIISITQKQGNNWSCGLITSDAIKHFNSTYVLPARIGPELGTSSTMVTQVLMAHGITPVSGTKAIGGHQYVFRKSDVGNVDLVSLIAAAKIKHPTRSNRKLVLITAEQAADLLNIDVNTLQKMVCNGLLKSYLRSTSGKTSGFHVSLFAVIRLKNQGVDYTRLITIAAAAKLFGQEQVVFIKNWVQSHYLEVQCTIEKQYLLFDDVQALIAIRQKAVTPGEAAKILGVGVKAVIWHMNAGRLKLAAGTSKKMEGKLFWRRDVERLSKVT